MRIFGCFSHTPPQITARQASIISIVWRDDVPGAAALEAVDADRRHAARRALVEADREVEILGRGPERLVHRVVDHLGAVIRVRPQEAAAEAELLAGEAHLRDRQVDRSCIGSIATPNSRSG